MSLYRLYPSCFICRKPVLRIVGEDYFVASSYCHLSCFHSFDDKAVFIKQVKEQLDKQGWDIEYQNQDLTIASHKPAFDLHIIRNDWLGIFNFDVNFREGEEGAYIPDTLTYYIYHKWGEPFASLYDQISEAFSNDKGFPFLDFIRALHVENTLMKKENLQNKMIYPASNLVEDLDGNIHTMPLADGELRLSVDYEIFIPDSIWNHVPQSLKLELYEQRDQTSDK